MSIRIKLKIKTVFDLESIEKNIELPLIQFKAKIKLWNGSSWTKSFEGIVDTGSPASLIPEMMWEEAKYALLSPHDFGISGISPLNTPSIPAKLAAVSCMFLDNANMSPPFNLRTYLLKSNDVPFVIGILDVLTRSKLFIDYENNAAHLEF